MIVDIHTHTFPDKIAGRTIEKLQGVSHSAAFSDGTAAGLRASMARAGVDRSVVLPVATHPGQVERVNDASARINETTEETGILSLGCIHPDFANWREELERVAALGLRGVKLHPVYQGVDLDDVRYLRILERCGELGLVVITHAGWDIGFPGQVNCSPQMVLRAVKQVGPVKLVLAHMGGWRCWDEVEELLWDTGVCLDTAFSLGSITPLNDGYYTPEDLPLLDEEGFMALVRKFGPRRVLFGTDSPWDDQAQAIARIRALPLTPEEREAILGGNAVKLLGLI